MRALILHIVPLPIDVRMSGKDFSSVASFCFCSDLPFELCHGFLRLFGGSGLVRFEKAAGFFFPDFVGRFGPFSRMVMKIGFCVGFIDIDHVDVAT